MANGRLSFSQRKKLLPIRLDFQREEIDTALRNKIWSALFFAVFNAGTRRFAENGENPNLIARRLWIHFFGGRLDEQPGVSYGVAGLSSIAKSLVLEGEWNRVYDFLEAIAEELQGEHLVEFASLINEFLEQEHSGYRLVGTSIVDIVEEEQLQSVQDELDETLQLGPEQTHLRSAIALLSDRKAPHYANSIKESILAVEALCQRLTAQPNATLGDAIKRLKDSEIRLHPALEQAWIKLYGYTSDSGGIRHALSGGPTVSQSDARYMLVSCSAFISHLLSLAATANMKLSGR